MNNRQELLGFMWCLVYILLTLFTFLGVCMFIEDDNEFVDNEHAMIESKTKNHITYTMPMEITKPIETERTTEVMELTDNITEKVEEPKTSETETDKEDGANQTVKLVSLGKFKLTAYCDCFKCCDIWALNRPVDENGKEIVYGAIGEMLEAGYSIAVDPSVIPYGTEVVINGHTYKAQDCGGAIKGNRIDVYHDNHSDALDFGVQYAEVFVKSE